MINLAENGLFKFTKSLSMNTNMIAIELKEIDSGESFSIVEKGIKKRNRGIRYSSFANAIIAKKQASAATIKILYPNACEITTNVAHIADRIAILLC